MQTRLLQTYSIITIISLLCITHATAHQSTDHDTTTPSASDYFNHITLYSDGRITRFTQMPIQVYISQSIKESTYLPEIRYAMQEWETASEELIKFKETDTPENADIHVNAGENSLSTYFDMRLGTIELTRHKGSTQIVFTPNHPENETKTPAELDGEGQPPDNTNAIDFSVEIILIPEGDGDVSDELQKEMRTVCLHEFGHALGLWGHSPNTDDVNHATATAQKPSKRDIDTLIKLYNTPLNTSQHDVAIELLKLEIKAKPNHPLYHYLLGSVYYDKGDMELAMQSIQECLKLDPKFSSASQKLLQIYDRTGQQTLAIELLEKDLARPDKTKTQHETTMSHNHLGVLHYREGNMDKAVQAFEKALELSPHNKTTKRNLHQIFLERTTHFLKTKDHDRAVFYCEKAIKLQPQDATAYKYLGSGYSQLGKYTEAIDFYQKALKMQPTDELTQKNLANTYVGYGVKLKDQKKWDEAISAYKQALKLMPNLQVATTNLADVYWKKANAFRESGNIDQAIDAYLELKKMYPDEPDIYSLLGELYLKKRHYPSALTAFQNAHTLKPDDPQARQNVIAVYLQYAQHLINVKDYKTAVEKLVNAVKEYPDELNLRLVLSQAYQETSEFDKAKTELEYILEKQPDHPQAKTTLFNMQVRRGNQLMQQKKYSAAVEAFEGIPETQKSTDIYNMIGYLYILKSDHLKALTAFDATLAKETRNNVAFQNIQALESRFVVRLKELSPPKEKTTEETSTEKQPSEPSNPKIDAVKTKLLQIQCSLAICLLNRGNPKNALAKYEQALKIKPEKPELQKHLIDTGKKLANIYQARNDIQKRDKIIQLVETLESSYKESLNNSQKTDIPNN